jgi:hypothetical protein
MVGPSSALSVKMKLADEILLTTLKCMLASRSSIRTKRSFSQDA